MKKNNLIMAVSATTHPWTKSAKISSNKKKDVVDTYFAPVNDPYRWMEDDRSDETALG
jgi:hypothetical protein